MTNRTRLLYGVVAILLIAAVVAVAAKFRNSSTVGDNDQNSSQNQTAQQNNQPNKTASPGQTAVTGCPNGTDPMSTDANGKFKPTIDISNKEAVMQTNFGTIVLGFYDQDAPKTVENFICLAQKGYYNGVTFHRVANGFVIQGGDPTGTGAGGESIYGSKFEDELNPNTPSAKLGYVKGTLAMANAGPNTNGSQFFITLSDVQLPLNYTIFGKVLSGMDVVEKIGALPTTPTGDGKPNQKVVIQSVTIQDLKK